MPDLSLRRERRRRPPASWVEKGPHPMAARVKEDLVRRRHARSRVSSPGGTHVGGPVPGGVRGGRPVPPSGARGGRPCAPAARTEMAAMAAGERVEGRWRWLSGSEMRERKEATVGGRKEGGGGGRREEGGGRRERGREEGGGGLRRESERDRRTE